MSIEERRSPRIVGSSPAWGWGDGEARGISEREVRVRECSTESTEGDSSSSKIAATDLGGGR